MATKQQATYSYPDATILPARSDAIRIVPLYVPRIEAKPKRKLAPPLLTYRNGPLIANAEVFVIYWGKTWQSAAQKEMAKKLDKFFDVILKSSLMKQMAEYSVPGKKIGNGKRTGSINISSPAMGKSVTDSAIRHMLQQQISTNAKVPKPNANSLYFVFTPPNVKVVQGGSASCQAFCGYHNDISGQIFYAVMPYADCSGCTASMGLFEAFTSTASHELCEAITDPIPGQGWYDDANGEVGDICGWKTKVINGYTVQLEWSNKAGKCI